MVDWIKPLKIETGSEEDSFPTEVDASEDGIQLKALGIEGSDLTIEKATNDMVLKDLSITTGIKLTDFAIQSTTITVNLSATNESVILCNAVSGNITVTLPLATNYNHKNFFIKKIDTSSNTVSVIRSGTDLIDGKTSFNIGKYSTMRVVSNGSGWYII